MKWFRPVINNIPLALQSIFTDGRYADKCIEYNFKHNKKWGGRDRKLFAESVYDIVRWWRLYLSILDFNDESPLSEEQYWNVLGVWAHHRGHVIPDWPEFEDFLSKTEFSERLEKIDNPAIKNSLPDWIWQMGEQSLADKWPKAVKALNSMAPVFLRVNTLKTSSKELQEALKAEGVDVRPTEMGLRLTERKNVFITESFKKGLFEVQDLGSQRIAPFLNVKPKMRVMDACAGAGGKTLHLSSLMENTGTILACDVHEWKLKELMRRASRAGANNIDSKLIQSKLIKRQADKMDALLLDVPCTGLGVLRRNPDSKWKLSEDRVDELIGLQREILQSYCRVVKPGGSMVYATCSILQQENQDQVKWFLHEHPGWELQEEMQLIPGEYPGDGFYMARLIKP